MSRTVELALLALALSVSGWSHAADSAKCESLIEARIPGVVLSESRLLAAEGELPARCLVAGTVSPSIGFEMYLPAESWNGRFLLAGCGAFCGQSRIPRGPGYSNTVDFAIKRGYAATQADAGHQGRSSTDTTWARNDPAAQVLYAHAWVPLASAASRAIIRAYYDAGEEFSYFSGCSNGGRTAAKVAQLYPSLFHGIASGAPGINATYAAGVQGIWWDRSLVDGTGRLALTADRVPILSNAVLAQCDGADGLVDSIVSRPDDCPFDPEVLRCKNDAAPDECLTSSELEAVKKLYAGPRTSSGQQLYPGVPLGSEPYWPRWLVGPVDGTRPHIAELGTNFLRSFGLPEDPGPGYTSDKFDLDRDIPRLEVSGRLYNATNPDLSVFARTGGKLLMYHGLADALTLPVESTRYYESVVSAMGGRERLDPFYRLFLVPGMDHCWGVTGLAPDIFDPLAVLEKWVEHGEPPAQIVATQYATNDERMGHGTIVRTRPLCPYPLEAQYTGVGSVDSAQSYHCAAVEAIRP